jgi:alpha-beta hydrolase superfamily lysophospholipase
MGGLIAADYAAHGERRLAGLLLLAPAFKVHETQIKLSGVEEFIKGRIVLNTEKKIRPSTREPGFMEARLKDPFVLPEIDSSYLVSIRLRQRDWPNSALLLKMPLFMGVAGHDEIVSPKAAKAVFDLTATPRDAKTWRHWDGARHTLCWDPLTPSIVEEMTEWMRETLK